MFRRLIQLLTLKNMSEVKNIEFDKFCKIVNERYIELCTINNKEFKPIEPDQISLLIKSLSVLFSNKIGIKFNKEEHESFSKV